MSGELHPGPEGYEDVKCEIQMPAVGKSKCWGNWAGFARRKQYAQVGPWLDACENCARQPYETPPQFQKESE